MSDLDMIERVLLMASVSRGERRGILGEVEMHVFELLGRRTTGEPTREDVLAVLAQLDPPESYAPEGFDRRMLNDTWSATRRREPQLSFMAVGSAAIGVFIASALAVSAIVFDDATLIYLGVFALLVVSIVGCCSLVRIHRSKGWLYGIRPGLFATLLFPLLAVNCFAALSLSVLEEIAIFAVVGFAFVTLNGAIIYALASLRDRASASDKAARGSPSSTDTRSQ